MNAKYPEITVKLTGTVVVSKVLWPKSLWSVNTSPPFDNRADLRYNRKRQQTTYRYHHPSSNTPASGKVVCWQTWRLPGAGVSYSRRQAC